MFQSNVLQHPHRNECITLSRNVPVIVFDEFHAAGQPQFFGAPAGEEDLFAGNVERPDGYAVTARHVQSQGAPPAACLDNALPWLELQLSADVIEFGGLRFLQRRRRRRKVGARINKLRVEPEPVKIGVQIVVMMDVLAGAAQGV